MLKWTVYVRNKKLFQKTRKILATKQIIQSKPERFFRVKKFPLKIYVFDYKG